MCMRGSPPTTSGSQNCTCSTSVELPSHLGIDYVALAEETDISTKPVFVIDSYRLLDSRDYGGTLMLTLEAPDSLGLLGSLLTRLALLGLVPVELHIETKAGARLRLTLACARLAAVRRIATRTMQFSRYSIVVAATLSARLLGAISGAAHALHEPPQVALRIERAVAAVGPVLLPVVVRDRFAHDAGTGRYGALVVQGRRRRRTARSIA